MVRCDGLKVSEDGQDVILFMRPEASEKPRKRVLLPGVDESSPDFDPGNDENYLYIPVEGDDERRFFIFLSAKKGCEMIKNWEERDPEEEPGGGRGGAVLLAPAVHEDAEGGELPGRAAAEQRLVGVRAGGKA